MQALECRASPTELLMSQHAIKRFHRSENVVLLSDIFWPLWPPICGGPCSAEHSEHAKICLCSLGYSIYDYDCGYSADLR